MVSRMTDREMVLKGIDCEEYNKCPECPYVKFGECKVLLMRDVRKLLKEQEKPKTGHWIPIKSPTGVEAFGIKEMTVFNVRCSVCGAEEDVSFTGYEFCPRCGAKMEGR